MRRLVKDRIAAALERERPSLEEFISQHLECPLGFPYRLAPAAVLIREVRTLKVAALAKADLPSVQVEVLLKAWLANRVAQIRGEWDPGVLDVDVQLSAHGAVAPNGAYIITARSAVLKAWWRDAAPLASKWLPRH